MKKQKKPIILILALAILFGGVAFMNRTPPKPGDDIPQAPPEKNESSASLAANVSQQLDAKPATPSTPQPKNHMMHGGPGGNSGYPSLQKPPMVNTKPKPNTSSTSAQWYTDEANKN